MRSINPRRIVVASLLSLALAAPVVAADGTPKPPAKAAPAPHHPVTRADLVRELRQLREALERASGGGGGINGPLGRTCAEARERARWSELPCAPDMPAR